MQLGEIRGAIAISFGAVAGALSRYYLTNWLGQRFGTSFPYGTFWINLSGCFGMGFFTTFALIRTELISPELRLLIGTGFLGAYTTFSTYGLETFVLLRTGNILPTVLYWGGSAILGVVCVWLGAMCAWLLLGKG
jgi:fluoride exporter